MTRSLYSWLTWFAYNCPWERGLQSLDLEPKGYAPYRRPPEVSDRFCTWVDLVLALSELSEYERRQVKGWICGMRERLPRATERKLARRLRWRGLV